MDSAKDTLVSIITVCYNAEDCMEKTIISVLNQSYPNIEYIIVDGKSVDGTLDIIKRYENEIDQLVSEPDKGIYDAMNKAVKYAHGDLIYFLNCGDYFYNNDVVQSVVYSYQENVSPGIIYGDIIVYDDDNHELWDMYRPIPFQVMTRCIFHQAIFAKKELFQQLAPFNSNYHVFADYNWLLTSVFIDKAQLRHITMPIAYYQRRGFSHENLKKSFHERLEIIMKHWKYYNFISVLRSNPTELLYFIILLVYLRLPGLSFVFEYLSKLLGTTNKKSTLNS